MNGISVIAEFMRKDESTSKFKAIEKEVFKISATLFNELKPGSMLVLDSTTYKVVAKYYNLVRKDADNPTKVMKRYIKVESELMEEV
jgi:hypothetical protein